jgi:hypothetical protein
MPQKRVERRPSVLLRFRPIAFTVGKAATLEVSFDTPIERPHRASQCGFRISKRRVGHKCSVWKYLPIGHIATA